MGAYQASRVGGGEDGREERVGVGGRATKQRQRERKAEAGPRPAAVRRRAEQVLRHKHRR
jgi:hypothetical protein